MNGWGTQWFLLLDLLIVVMLALSFALGYRAGRSRG